jgi:hypothetical protein
VSRKNLKYMITYVNTVLVSNLANGTLLKAAPAAAASMNTPSADAGKFIIENLDADAADKYAVDAKTQKIRIGIVTKKNVTKVNHKTGAIEYLPIIKWSNAILKNDIKSYNKLAAAGASNTEDTVAINFAGLSNDLKTLFAKEGKRIIVRLTFKDLPTRYRKWTESYEYVTKAGDTPATIAAGIAAQINKQYKRARVVASVSTATVTLVAMPYDDDDAADTINVANKVRFNANIYYTDPAAEGWESLNKHYPTGVTIVKTPGEQYAASGKLVRDLEVQAMGYEGILNRGEGTWPIIKPEVEAQNSVNYDAITLEFENMYRAADDIFRKTKQVVNIFGNKLTAINAVLDVFAGVAAPANSGSNNG